MSRTLPALAALVFLAAITAAAAAGRLPVAIAAAYLILSVALYFLYARDKTAARERRWRTAESTLLFWGLVGGWPGGLLAQQRLRHKSGKRSFMLRFWLTVLANLAGLGWWLLSTA